jgi:hypothetical protein
MPIVSFGDMHSLLSLGVICIIYLRGPCVKYECGTTELAFRNLDHSESDDLSIAASAPHLFGAGVVTSMVLLTF